MAQATTLESLHEASECSISDLVETIIIAYSAEVLSATGMMDNEQLKHVGIRNGTTNTVKLLFSFCGLLASEPCV